MLDSVERQIVSRLTRDPAWASGRMGNLARRLVDYEVPIPTAAAFIGVHHLVLRRWLYGYGTSDNPVVTAPGGSLSTRRQREARIDRLSFLLDQVRWARGLRARWSETLDQLDRTMPYQ